MKKILLVSSFFFFTLSFIATLPVKAQNIDSQVNDLTPRKLIGLARQGRFSNLGIPGYSGFGSAVRSGNINAEQLISSAIAQNRLPESTLQDRNFVNAVEKHLKSGGCSSN